MILKRWLREKEANAYAAIPVAKLRWLADNDHITGLRNPDDQRGGMIYDRVSIDKYRNSQVAQIKAGDEKADEAARDILKRAGMTIPIESAEEEPSETV